MPSRSPDPLDEAKLLQAAAVRRLFGGVSAMWLWRRQKDGTLPPPILIAGRRFWSAQQVTAVIENMKRAAPSQQLEDPADISRSDVVTAPEEINRRRPARRHHTHGQPPAESDAL